MASLQAAYPASALVKRSSSLCDLTSLQAREMVSLETYKRGDLAAAISEAYYRMDELLGTQHGKQDLDALIGGGAATESKG